ncbi:hypothetical protein PIB30_105475 [Stylosanthes scabra]|uniref:Uncharacterized protein n=1 Tax=Stylosanthes scabra TaxID=79078 RepID=A0ABU6VX51_9FABA|nr:hypothetical protein [Stylosanthes scabra]
MNNNSAAEDGENTEHNAGGGDGNVGTFTMEVDDDVGDNHGGRMNNNLAAADGANAEENVGVSKSRGWKLRKKFPRPPPSYRSSTASKATTSRFQDFMPTQLRNTASNN